jgi:hypothetical protein
MEDKIGYTTHLYRTTVFNDRASREKLALWLVDNNIDFAMDKTEKGTQVRAEMSEGQASRFKAEHPDLALDREYRFGLTARVGRQVNGRGHGIFFEMNR